MSTRVNANEIVKGVWIGDWHAATNPKFIEENKIGAIVNCTPDIPCKFASKGVHYMRLRLDDSLKRQDINKMTVFLPSAVDFIFRKKNKEGKNILIHCHAGMQRSAAVTCAYLCDVYGISLNKAVELVVKKRPVAFHHCKHINFFDSLVHYRKKK